MSQAILLRRHMLRAVCLVALCQIISIITIDSPKQIYHCPLDRDGLAHRWTDENCYWSSTYAEAREKFVSLGNRLKEQVHLVKAGGTVQDVALDILDIQSISYDISREDFPKYIKSSEASNSPQAILPEIDTIDALLITMRVPEQKANRENVNIIHSSGTHGVEGYVGSAVQIRFLHELYLQSKEQIVNTDQSVPSSGDKVQKILLIHSVNPYGMRHHRRTNENNVDLNRNVLSEEMWRDMRKRNPNFASYVDMDSTLNPFQPVVDEDGNIFSWVDAVMEGGVEGDMISFQRQDDKVKNTIYKSKDKVNPSDLLKLPDNSIRRWLEEKKDTLQVLVNVIAAIATLGFENAKRGLVSSQYHKLSGLSYGGGAHNNNQWENSIFSVQHAIHEFAAFNSASSRAVWIDVHTGLGKYGDYSLLMFGNRMTSHTTEDARDADYAWITKLTNFFKKSQLGSGDASVSAGYDQTFGIINGDILCPQPQCFPLSQEFGTRPGAAVAAAMVLENWGHRSLGGRYGHMTSWAFNPHRLSWRRKSMRGGIDMLHACLEF